jgi:hypothetical protein
MTMMKVLLAIAITLLPGVAWAQNQYNGSLGHNYETGSTWHNYGNHGVDSYGNVWTKPVTGPSYQPQRSFDSTPRGGNLGDSIMGYKCRNAITGC